VLIYKGKYRIEYKMIAVGVGERGKVTRCAVVFEVLRYLGKEDMFERAEAAKFNVCVCTSEKAANFR
jgi:hypothetical protein